MFQNISQNIVKKKLSP